MLNNTIRMELYSIRHSKSFRLILLIQLVLSVVFTVAFIFSEISIGTFINGRDALFNALWDTSIPILFSGIWIGLYVGTDFQNRVVNIQISKGHSRLDIVLGKSISYFLSLIPFCVIYPIVRAVICTILFGWGETITFDNLLITIITVLLCVFLTISTCSIFLFFVFFFRDSGRTIACSILFYPVLDIFMSLLGSKVAVIKSLYQMTPFFLTRSVIENGITSVSAIVSLIFYSLLWMCFCFLIFRKKELA